MQPAKWPYARLAFGRGREGLQKLPLVFELLHIHSDIKGEEVPYMLMNWMKLGLQGLYKWHYHHCSTIPAFLMYSILHII